MDRMGTFRVPIEIASADGGRYERFEALVDTGASYTVVPRDRLESLGVVPEEPWPFVLADGNELNCDIGWARVRMGTKSHLTIVVFGAPGAEALLGAYTLEGFHLAVDPVKHRLVPVPGLLKRTA